MWRLWLLACAFGLALVGQSPVPVTFAWNLAADHEGALFEVETNGATVLACGPTVVTPSDRRCTTAVAPGTYSFRIRAIGGEWSSPVSATIGSIAAAGPFLITAHWESQGASERMSAAVQSSGVSPGAESTTVVIAKPSGLAAGDLMVALAYFRQGGITITPPSGWTSIQKEPTVTTGETFWKIADSGDVAGSTFTFTSSGASVANIGGMVRISGHNATTPIDGSNKCGGGADGGLPRVWSGFTPTQGDVLLLVMAAEADDSSAGSAGTVSVATSNPTWTEAFDFGTNAGDDAFAMCAYATRTQSTATGNAQYTGAGGGTVFHGFLIGIAPESVAAGQPTMRRWGGVPHVGGRKAFGRSGGGW